MMVCIDSFNSYGNLDNGWSNKAKKNKVVF